MTRIYLSPPDVGAREREYLLRAFDSGWVAPLGPEVDGFEQEIARFAGADHAVALSSGTAALHLGLKVLGVKSGDRVLTSTLTFVATANAITYCGADPVFIDSERSTWNLDPDLLAEELRESAERGELPAAVVPVDIFGQCADYESILSLCSEYGVPVLEDAAEALGATYQGRPAGSFGEIGVFSFNGNKIMTTSGGGMLVTDDARLAAEVTYLATQARDPVPHYEHRTVGYNYRLSNLLAAIGRAQLEELPQKITRRREIRSIYRRALGDVPGVDFMPEAPEGMSNAWLTVITVNPDLANVSARGLMTALDRIDVESRPIWKPMHMQPAFMSSPRRGGSVAESLFTNGLCLPSGSSLSDSDVGRIVERIVETVQSAQLVDSPETLSGRER